jgi:hypothetical protein
MAEAAKNAHGLRVLEGGQRIDEDGEVYVQSSELALVKQQLKEAEEALRLERAKVTKLKREKSELQEVDPEGPAIMDVLTHWKEVTGHPKATIPLSGRRAAAVRRQLRNFTADELKLAATGAGKFPWERYGKHYAEQGVKEDGREHRNDATYIFANNEKRIEYLIGLAAADPGHEQYAKWLHEQCCRRPLLVKSLAWLALEREPHGEVIARCAVWAARKHGPARRDVARESVLRCRVVDGAEGNRSGGSE